jgi:hypothetical protein
MSKQTGIPARNSCSCSVPANFPGISRNIQDYSCAVKTQKCDLPGIPVPVPFLQNFPGIFLRRNPESYAFLQDSCDSWQEQENPDSCAQEQESGIPN